MSGSTCCAVELNLIASGVAHRIAHQMLLTKETRMDRKMVNQIDCPMHGLADGSVFGVWEGEEEGFDRVSLKENSMATTMDHWTANSRVTTRVVVWEFGTVWPVTGATVTQMEIDCVVRVRSFVWSRLRSWPQRFFPWPHRQRLVQILLPNSRRECCRRVCNNTFVKCCQCC